ncbi:MAG TPA: prolyl oligopeptidase family serine peptidase [Acidimicrobiales bacterium]|nr:prolyl oligopeptidase family serine peptidase [Acidimicrobiales bacterium]
MRESPYGSWPSPVAPELLVASAVRLSTVVVDGDVVYWLEGRPSEAGRQVLVRRLPGGVVEDAIPDPMAARTFAHEYGGRCFDARAGVVVFSNFEDQRLCRGDGSYLTPSAEELGFSSVRYADHHLSPDARDLLCVRERHPRGGGPADVVTDLVSVRLADGTSAVVASGNDFYLAPRWSPDGSRVAWLTWCHPDMPWDATELWVAGADGTDPTRVAGGPGISVSQPRWSPEGVLHWASDESGWWRIAREDGVAMPFEPECEYSGPDWVFGQSTYDFLGDGELVCVAVDRGIRRLVGLGTSTPFAWYDSVVADDDGIVCIAASPTVAPAVVRIDSTGQVDVLRESQPALVDPSTFSRPESIEFPTSGHRSAHAFFYRPVNPSVVAPADSKPPLLVLSHGGPTSAASPTLNLGIQFWTSRGFAVVDVNYGGSTGYGRAYRERLRGAWGITDVDDCVAAAHWLVDEGEVDGSRMVARGGSAGGYTTLAALTFRAGVFAAGSSHYGVADLEALALDTHKFESRYLDGLVGPYPEEIELYRERSPIHHTERLASPLILFQGLDDKVVPPAQSEAMAAALRRKGIAHSYLAFEAEQHGFRRAETILAVARAELFFLGRVLGFVPADDLAPVAIVHEGTLPH